MREGGSEGGREGGRRVTEGGREGGEGVRDGREGELLKTFVRMSTPNTHQTKYCIFRKDSFIKLAKFTKVICREIWGHMNIEEHKWTHTVMYIVYTCISTKCTCTCTCTSDLSQ